MPMTPDHRPGQVEYADIGTIYADAGSNIPVTVGAIGYANALFSLTDGQGTYDPRLVYTLTHSQIADLIHYLDDGPTVANAYKVTTYTGSTFLKTITWYTDSTQAKKIVDRTLGYPSGSFAVVTSDVWRVFAADGVTVVHQVSDTINYQGILETSRTRSYS